MRVPQNGCILEWRAVNNLLSRCKERMGTREDSRSLPGQPPVQLPGGAELANSIHQLYPPVPPPFQAKIGTRDTLQTNRPKLFIRSFKALDSITGGWERGIHTLLPAGHPPTPTPAVAWLPSSAALSTGQLATTPTLQLKRHRLESKADKPSGEYLQQALRAGGLSCMAREQVQRCNSVAQEMGLRKI